MVTFQFNRYWSESDNDLLKSATVKAAQAVFVVVKVTDHDMYHVAATKKAILETIKEIPITRWSYDVGTSTLYVG